MGDDHNDETSLAETLRYQEAARLDWFLQALVSIANTLSLGISVTLTVGGTLVCGQLIGGREYFELWTGSFRSMFPRSLQPGLHEAFEAIEGLGEKYGDPTDDPGLSDPAYIHLKNVLFFAGQAPVSHETMLWRGRIAAVDGFALGSFKPR